MNYSKQSGFTFLETIIALAIFVVLIVGGNVLLNFIGSAVVDLQTQTQLQLLAENGAELSESLFLHDASWKTDLGGSPKTAQYTLEWDGINYTLHQADNTYEGPINVFSEASSDGDVFYRKILVEEKNAFGLYEIQVDVCANECNSHVYLYKLFTQK